MIAQPISARQLGANDAATGRFPKGLTDGSKGRLQMVIAPGRIVRQNMVALRTPCGGFDVKF